MIHNLGPLSIPTYNVSFYADYDGTGIGKLSASLVSVGMLLSMFDSFRDLRCRYLPPLGSMNGGHTNHCK